jgi:hypothetical protein
LISAGSLVRAQSGPLRCDLIRMDSTESPRLSASPSRGRIFWEVACKFAPRGVRSLRPFTTSPCHPPHTNQQSENRPHAADHHVLRRGCSLSARAPSARAVATPRPGMSRNTDIPVRFFPRFDPTDLCLGARNYERLGIMRRVAIDQYRMTASVAPHRSIMTSRTEAVRDGTKD